MARTDASIRPAPKGGAALGEGIARVAVMILFVATHQQLSSASMNTTRGGDVSGGRARCAPESRLLVKPRDRKSITQLAVVMDVRSRGFTGDLDSVRTELATRNIAPRVVFMEASDDMLVRRYEQNRRSHPLQGEQTLAEGIAAERGCWHRFAPPPT